MREKRTVGSEEALGKRQITGTTATTELPECNAGVNKDLFGWMTGMDQVKGFVTTGKGQSLLFLAESPCLDDWEMGTSDKID